MKPKSKNRRILSIIIKILRILIVVIFIQITSAWMYYTHIDITSDAVKLILERYKDNSYEEIKNYEEKLRLGTGEEDNYDRQWNHYGVQDGLWCHDWMLDPDIVALYKGDLGPPPSEFKERRLFSAYQWANDPSPVSEVKLFRNGDKQYTWRGAIEAYDYSDDAKKLAYERLGHVLHLAADVCDPDHVHAVAHPGSSKVWPDDLLDKINGYITKDKFYQMLLKQLSIDLFDLERAVGFEKLVEENENARKHDIPSLEIKQWNAIGSKKGELKDYFSIPAEYAGDLRHQFQQKPWYSALGLSPLPVVDGSLRRTASYYLTLIKMYEPHIDQIYIIPEITEEKKQPYVDLAVDLTKVAKEYSAGLIMLFHDVMRHPPYVQEIKIGHLDEGGNLIEAMAYLRSWGPTDDKSTTRDIIPKELKPGLFQTCRETYVEITFGPSIDGKESIIIDANSVWATVGVIGTGKAIRFQLKKKKGFDDGIKPAVFEGIFVPPIEFATISLDPDKAQMGYINIEAQDIYNHYYLDGSARSLERSGRNLDSNPGTVARVTDFNPPYPWEGYEPGTDQVHDTIGKFFLAPLSVSYVNVSQADTGYGARWEPECIENIPIKTDRKLSQTSGLLSTEVDTKVTVWFAPYYPDNLLRAITLRVFVGVDGASKKEVFMLKELGGGPFFSGYFTPPATWSNKRWGFVEVSASDCLDREIDSDPKDVPELIPSETWNFYQPGTDATYKGAGTFEFK